MAVIKSFFLFLLLILSIVAAAEQSELNVTVLSLNTPCQYYLAPPRLERLLSQPYILNASDVKRVFIQAPGLGNEFLAIDLDDLDILDPTTTMALGLLTHKEAAIFAENFKLAGGGWRLPMAEEILALSKLGYGKTAELSSLKTIWAREQSGDEKANRLISMLQQAEMGGTGEYRPGYLWAKVQSQRIQKFKKELARSRAYHLHTSAEATVPPAQEALTKFMVLFVRNKSVSSP